MQVTLREKNYDYIAVDENNKVHIFVPLCAGFEIGMDNTCRAIEEFNKFSDSVKKIIMEYLKDLQNDILILNLTPGLDEIKKLKNDRLMQARKYKELFDKGLSYSYSPLLNFVLGNGAINGGSILLSPQNKDYSRALGPYLFSLSANFYPNTSDSFSRVQQKVTETFSNKDIRLQLYEKVKQEVSKKIKEKMGENAQLTHIVTDEQLNLVKNAFATVIKESYSDLLFNEFTDSWNTTTNVDYFTNTTLLVEPGDKIDAWLPNILSIGTDSTMLDTFIANHNDSPFIKLTHGLKLNNFSCCIQFLFGLLNLYYYEQTGDRKNFSNVLEEPTIFNEFTNRLEADANKGIYPEDSIINFINERSGSSKKFRFFFPNPLTKEEIAIVKNRFKVLWTSIEDSPHFDEFILFSSAKKGHLYNYCNRISVHASDFVGYQANQYQELFGNIHRDCFGGEIPFLAKEPAHGPKIKNNKISIDLSLLSDESLVTYLLLGAGEILKDPNFIREIQAKPNYLEILTQINSRNSEILKYFGFTNPYVLDPILVHHFYQKNSPEEESLSGINRLKAALVRENVSYDRLTINDDGQFVLHIESYNVSPMPTIKRLFERYAQNYLEISEHELRFRILKNIDLNALNTQQIELAIKRRLLERYNLNDINLQVRKQGEAFLITSNIKTIHKLRQLALESLTVSLQPDQLNELLLTAGLRIPPNDPRRSIERALTRLKLPYQMVIKNGENWDIIASSDQSKNRLENITNRDNFEENRLARERERKERRRNSNEIVFVAASACLFGLLVAGLLFPPILFGIAPIIPIAITVLPAIISVAGGFGVGALLSGLALGCKKLFDKYSKKQANPERARQANEREVPQVVPPIIQNAAPANVLEPILLPDSKRIALQFLRYLPGAQELGADIDAFGYPEIINLIGTQLSQLPAGQELELAKSFYSQTTDADRPLCVRLMKTVLNENTFSRFIESTLQRIGNKEQVIDARRNERNQNPLIDEPQANLEVYVP